MAAYVNRGNAYTGKGDYDRAITDLNQAIRSTRTCKAYQYKLDDDRAISDFDQAIRLDPKYALAYVSRGDFYSDGAISTGRSPTTTR